MKSFSTDIPWLFLMLFVCLFMQSSGSDNQEQMSTCCNSDTDKWHPTTFYIVYPDMRVVFKLPYEKDQSGVANLLFRNKETGDIHLLDTIKNKKRYYNPLSGKYDAILLYNNGKYVVYNDVAFEKDITIEVDMEHLNTQPSDTESHHWLTLRSFLESIDNKERIFVKKSVSEKKIRGYILIENGFAGDFPFARIARENNKRTGSCTFDGYFEIDFDEPVSTLEFFCIGHNFEYLNVVENSGIFYVLKGYDRETLENVKTGVLQ